MDFLKKRMANKSGKEPVVQEEDSAIVRPASAMAADSVGEVRNMLADRIKKSDSETFVRQQRVVQTRHVTSLVTSSSDFQMVGGQRVFVSTDQPDVAVPLRSGSPFRVPAKSFAFDQIKGDFDNMLITNGSSSYRPRPREITDGSSSAVTSRQSLDSLSLLRQCEGSASIFPKYSLQQSGQIELADPMDLAIEATLQKTMEIFQRMVDQERAELVRMFPQLGNVRRTATADQGPGTEIIIEKIPQPDGSVVEVRKVRTTQVMRVSKSMYSVNGVVQNTQARAIMEYQGPNGGYRLKLEEETDRDVLPPADSETEEEDDDSDRRSLAPSEISDTTSVTALIPRSQSHRPNRGNAVPHLQVKPKKKTDKAWFAAQELVESERRYVEKLRLLDQVFRIRVEADTDLAKSVAKEKLATFFANIGTLYKFHNDHLLPQLEAKLRDWRQTQKICDVMSRQAPFLKIYGEYTGNYKKSTKTFDDLKKASKRFAAIVNEIEKVPECDLLPLSSHMICPVQRVTRYHLLMTEYLRNLDDGHPDKEDTKHALELTKEAASHANHMMRQFDKYKNVIEVQEQLGSQVQELLTPSRELVKKGRLMKISARSGEHQARYLFLFNDMLLICSEQRSIVLSALSGKYKLRAIFEVDGMNVLEGDNLEVENTFYVRSGNKMVELYTSEAKEKTTWMETLWSVIQEHNTRMQSFRKPGNKMDQPPPIATPSSTEAANNHESCSHCAAVFNAFKKSYICKSCGAVICKKCCQKKIKLHDSEKEQRVCFNCYETLKSSSPSGATASDSPRNGVASGAVTRKPTLAQSQVPQSQLLTRKNILDVKPSDTSIWSGYLDLKSSNRKSWDRRFFALQQDMVLYAFRTDKDVCAKTSLPITGCRVSWVDPRQDSTLASKDANAFKVQHGRRVYYLKADSDKEMAKCVAAFELASQAQLPPSGA